MRMIIRRKFKSAHYISYKVEYKFYFHAKPTFAVYPISYVWSLGEELLKEGEGSIVVNNTKVEYKIRGKKCEFQTEIGKAFKTRLGLKATDNRGRVSTSFIPINVTGIEKEGGRMEKKKRKKTLEYIANLANQVHAIPKITPEVPPTPQPSNPRLEFKRAIAKGMNFDLKELELE